VLGGPHVARGPDVAQAWSSILKSLIQPETFIIHILKYRAFHRFGQAKFAYAGSILGLSQFMLLPLKTMLDLKVVKIDSKVIISIR